jgi:hypothetical protein
VTTHWVDIRALTQEITNLGLAARCLLYDADTFPEINSQLQIQQFPALLFIRHRLVLDVVSGSDPRDTIYQYFGVEKGLPYY